MAEKAQKNKSRVASRLYALVVIFLGVLILAVTVVFLFQTQSMKVEGMEYGSEEAVEEWVKTDKLSVNTLYLFWKYNLQEEERLPFMNDVTIKFKAPWSVKVIVNEKKIVGSLEKDNQYYYFDKDGMIVLISEFQEEDVPEIDGVLIKELKLYETIETADKDIFENILEVTQLLKRERLVPDRIFCRGGDIALYFEGIRVELGSSGFEHKIVQLTPVFEKIQGETGVLHMEHYSENSKGISFRKVDPNAPEPEEGADGETEGENKADEGGEADNPEDTDNPNRDSDTADEGTSLDYGDNIDTIE